MSGFRSWSRKFWSKTLVWCLRASSHVKKLPSLKVSSPKLSRRRAFLNFAPQMTKSIWLETWTLTCRKILSISSQCQTWARSLSAPILPCNRRRQRPAPSNSTLLVVGRKLFIIHRWWPLTRLRWSVVEAPTSTIASSMTRQRTCCDQLHRWLAAQTASRPASTVRSRGLEIRSAISGS